MTHNLHPDYHFGLIGNPVEHSLSPVMFTLFSQITGLVIDYQLFKLPMNENFSDEFQKTMDNCSGLNVTIPFKRKVSPFLHSLDPPAEVTGAVNVIYRKDNHLIGTNTDVFGFGKALEVNGINPKDLPIYLIGNGGSARAVAYGLTQMNCYRVNVVCRSEVKFRTFKQHLEDHLPELSVNYISAEKFRKKILPAKSLLINCTPLGMYPDTGSSPVSREQTKEGIIYFDLVYNPPETSAMRIVRQTGGKATSGLDMLIFQGLEALRIWTGEDIFSAENLQHLKNQLLRYLRERKR